MPAQSPFALASLLKTPAAGVEDDLTVRGRMARGGLVSQPDTDSSQAYGDRLRSLTSARDWMSANPLGMNAGPESTGPASSSDRMWDYMRAQQGVPALAAAAAGKTATMPLSRTQAPPSFETDWLRGNATRAAAGAAQDANAQGYVDSSNALNMALSRGEITTPQHTQIRSRLDALGSRYGRTY